MEVFSWYGYIAWFPLLSWVLLFHWFWRYSSPLYLRKMVKKGRKWAVMPDFVSKDKSFASRTRLKCVAFSFVASALSACTVAWVMALLELGDAKLGFASTAVFLVFAVLLYRIAVKKVASTYETAYFYEYRRVRYESERDGTFRSETDLNNRTVWSFTKKLRNAESHRRLWKYVHAMARSKKVAPDILAGSRY